MRPFLFCLKVVKNMNTIMTAFNYMKTMKLKYLAAVLAVGISTIFLLLVPLVIRITIDSVIGTEPLNLPGLAEGFSQLTGGREYWITSLWLPALLIIILTLFRGLFLYWKGRWAAEAAEEMARNLRDELFQHLQYLSFSYHVNKDTGDLIQRCTSDLETVRRFFAVQLVEVGRAIFMLGIIAGIMFYLDPFMTGISLLVVPVIFLFSYIFFHRVRVAFRAADEAEAELSTFLQENLTGVRVVKAFARQPEEVKTFIAKNCRHRDLTFRLIRLLAYFWSFSDFICFLQIGLVLLVGTQRAAAGQLTLGTLVVFVTYEGMLLWPVRQAGRILTDLGKSQVAVERMQQILNEPREDFRQLGLQKQIRGRIEVRNLSFNYQPGEPVLENISFTVQPGETLGILGSTGSGKSTLTYLLTRLYDYQQGSIKIDGRELKEYDRGWIRQQIGLILQEPYLFARSIKDNIALAAPEVESSELERAAEIAAVHEVVSEFDRGYLTEVGERGVSLSGGQKQRLSIARTLVRNCPVMIFDDSLSAVDTKTDLRIRQALKNNYADLTKIIISHRISTLASSDQILVLEQGKIVQLGTHQELIKEPGIYRRTWQLQNEEEIVS